jgi:hypothetical protein
MAYSGMLRHVAHQDRRMLRRLLVTASVVPGAPILASLMKEALSSSETSVLTRATWRNIQSDAILHGKYMYEVCTRCLVLIAGYLSMTSQICSFICITYRTWTTNVLSYSTDREAESSSTLQSILCIF